MSPPLFCGPVETVAVLPAPTAELPAGPHADLVYELIDQSVILAEEWEELDPASRHLVLSSDSRTALLERLTARHVLTPFQRDIVLRGSIGDLTLGHYRLLDILGRGGMGVVYKAENIYLRRIVALKVISSTIEVTPKLLHRFYAEARAAARLQHPNLVSCLDAGRHHREDGTCRDYFVMELVKGSDLAGMIRNHGPLPVERACDLFRQVAEALAEAHRCGLVHRDIKPTNIQVTAEWQAKLLDFGLALHPRRRVTEPGTLLGTVSYMAPEQAKDPHQVDARADIFALGSTMYYALTGREPFPDTGDLIRDLTQRFAVNPQSVAIARPELPSELATLIDRMMCNDPDERPQSARVVALTLAGLCRRPSVRNTPHTAEKPLVVVVDDDPALRGLTRRFLADEYAVAETQDGEELLDLLKARHVDLIVLDLNLPGLCGEELLSEIRLAAYPQSPPKILLVSGSVPEQSLLGHQSAGADGCMPKPFTRNALLAQVRRLTGRPQTQAMSRVVPSGTVPAPATLRIGVAELTRTPAVSADPPSDLVDLFDTRAAAVSADPIAVLTTMLGQMSHEVLGQGKIYGKQLARYIRTLAAAVRSEGEYARLKDERFLDLLCAVAPLHDMGQLAVPGAILHKPGPLDDQERLIVQTHTTLGSEWVVATATEWVDCSSKLALAGEVVRSHHERWDGAGYPDGIAGTEIPLGARVVGLVTVYHALRSRRSFRPGLSHPRAIRMIGVESPGQFDPTLVTAMMASASTFEQIFRSDPG